MRLPPSSEPNLNRVEWTLLGLGFLPGFFFGFIVAVLVIYR